MAERTIDRRAELLEAAVRVFARGGFHASRGVLVGEVARSPGVGNRVDEIRGLFGALQGIIEAARDRGEVRPDVEAQIAAWAFYGALEEILTGWVLGQLPGEEEDIERAVATVVEVAHAGLAA